MNINCFYCHIKDDVNVNFFIDYNRFMCKNCFKLFNGLKDFFKNNRIIVIFDSVDMSGKSNILVELSRVINIPYYKNTKEQSRWKDKLISLVYGQDELVQFLEQTNYSIIFDRFHASEWVYSKHFNRISNEEVVYDLDKRIAKMNGVIVFPFKTEEFFVDDDLDIVKISDYKALNDLYLKFFKLTKCNVIMFCSNDCDLGAQVLFICEKLKEMYL